MKTALLICFSFCFFVSIPTQAQIIYNCSSLNATFTKQESRCTSTGSILVTASGGSGNYNYKVTGTLNTSFTSSNLISGLPPGTYKLVVQDVVSLCTVEINNITITGNYIDPSFTLQKTDPTCFNGSDGTITTTNFQNGRAPFTFSIIAPSASNVGASNSTGSFSHLTAGDYYIQLRDSCGGIQTRLITIQNFDWYASAYTVTRIGCDSASVVFSLADNKGNTNLPPSITFNGFLYGYLRAPGDTVWTSNRSFNLYLGTKRSLTLLVKDPCGNVKKYNWTDQSIRPVVDATVTISNRICSTFKATVTGQQNLIQPEYCLYTNSNTLVTCNTTGIFDNIAYGSYCIRIRDNCYDTTISRCFSASPNIPSIGTVSNNNLACSTFTATVGSQNNLTNPQFCLYNAAQVLISCNSTGIFNNIPYGSYCIKMQNDPACYDTLIQRCFTVNRPVPSVGGSISIGNRSCATFRGSVTGQSNLTNPQYCIYDSTGALIGCNTSGSFTNLQYGSYCIRITNNPACYDTTITRCFSVSPSRPSISSSISISKKGCTTFRATVSGQNNLTNPQYCIYSNNTLITCNTTGIFDNLPYGSYCINVINDSTCYDTTIVRCFTVNRNRPSVNSSISIGQITCTNFSASVTGQTNLNNPNYCLYTSTDSLISCNTTGEFYNIPFGNYCIRIKNDSLCYDTTIVRCFSRTNATPLDFTASSVITCDLGITEIQARFNSGTSPYSVTAFLPGGTQVYNSGLQTASTFAFTLPDLSAGLRYLVVGTDACGNHDSVLVDPVSRSLTRSTSVKQRCPGGIWPNGSGEITANHQLSSGTITTSIIRKNNTTVLINPDTYTPTQSLFTNLGPATYVIRYNYTGSGCNRSVYDTVTVNSYQFPSLAQSSAFQCNNNSFSIGAAVQNGAGPFTFEIIGSIPETPSLAGMQQTSPVFTINNGTVYSLIRLRVTDACFNATLNDVSILPLANLVITATSNCYYNNVNLSVAPIPNADYKWYKKTSAADSIQVGTNNSYAIPYLLPSDTGMYVCVTSVNSGCLTRISYFHLDGACFEFLGNKQVVLNGKAAGASILLNWGKPAELTAKEFIVERAIKGGDYKSIGSVAVLKSQDAASYMFTDPDGGSDHFLYRIKIIRPDGSYMYSNTISMQQQSFRKATIYPNPLRNISYISTGKKTAGNYVLEAFTITGQKLFTEKILIPANGAQIIERNRFKAAGTYMIRLKNMNDGTSETLMLKVE